MEARRLPVILLLVVPLLVGLAPAPVAAQAQMTCAVHEELGFLNAIGPRVEESGLGLIALHPYSAPYEDLKLKK